MDIAKNMRSSIREALKADLKENLLRSEDTEESGEQKARSFWRNIHGVKLAWQEGSRSRPPKWITSYRTKEIKNYFGTEKIGRVCVIPVIRGKLLEKMEVSEDPPG